MSDIASPAPTTVARRLSASRWATLPVVLAGTFMVILDFFVVNVAMPALQADLHASAGAIEWVIAGYGLSYATLLITAGRLGDLLGRRRMFSLGLGLFTLASAACGLATDPTMLIAARVVQGVAAALLTPNVLSIIGVTYAGEDRLRALSAYGIVLGLAAVGGQLIGGALIEADIAGLGWRSLFLINIPIGIAALAFAPRLVAESRVDDGARLDLAGTTLITVALVAAVFPLVEGRQEGWPLWTWLSLAAAPVALTVFALQQRSLSARGGAPLLDPALFRDRAVSAGLVTQVVFWCCQASFFLVLALYLQQGRGLGALQAGLVFTILAAAYLVASTGAPKLIARLGRRLPAIGAITLAAGHALLAATVAAIGSGGSIAVLAPALLVIGAGMGLVITPLTTTVLAGVAPHHAGAASGALSTMQQVGGALGVAVTGVIFFGAVGHGVAHAFELSLVQLAATCAAVAALTRLLPATRRAGAAR
jgi:EmrB/QacA subfamily drug resistance transporter